MKLAKLPFFEKSEASEYFLSLILRNEKAKAVIFEKKGGNLIYVNSDEEDFTNTIEDASTDEFVSVLDRAITRAESALSKTVDKYKTILALKDNWIENDKIKKEYLEKLKKAGDELSLNPIGFLTFSESITNLLQKEEGAPITAILAEVGKKYITVYYIKAGRVMEARTSEIHQSASFTVDTLLKHLETPQVMPARVILLDSEEDELTQEFINHQWSKSLNFLHFPQILTLPINSDTKAVLLGAATQMGAHLVFDTNRPIEESENVGVEDEAGVPPPIRPANLNEEKDGSELDYVGKDGSMDFFGFSKKDVVDAPPVAPGQEPNSEEIPVKTSVGVMGVLSAEKAKETFAKITSSFKRLNLRQFFKKENMKDKKMLLVGAGLLVLFILFFFLFLFQTKAKVNLFVKVLDKKTSADVTFSPNSSTKLDENILEATIVPVEESGSVSVEVSGKKDVGTKAKGAVTIFNNDTDPVKIPSGTVITSSNGLKFALDSGVSIASASGDVFSGTKPGTANVNVTAADIGTEYNLPSDTKFSFSGTKTIAAKNDHAFTGGTKKNVNVVSKADLDRARTALPKELSSKAKSDILGRVEKGKSIIPEFIDTDITDENFDKKEGDEADKITLKATVAFNYIAYTDSDMADLAEKLFEDKNLLMQKSSIKVSAKKIKVQKDRSVNATVEISFRVLPKIDVEALSKQIAGQDATKAKNSLGNLDNVEDAEISVSPPIPFLSSTLPKNPKNIEINVSAR